MTMNRGDRIHRTKAHIKKQTDLRQDVYKLDVDYPHRYHKLSFATCGNPKCVMCSNPRKIFSELTIQEQSLFQKELLDFESD